MTLNQLLREQTNDILSDAQAEIVRTYVKGASKPKAPSLNLQSLFAGTDGE